MLHPAACPFCASSQVSPIEIDAQVWAVCCEACSAIGPHAASDMEAMQRWDIRGRHPGEAGE